MRIGHDSNGDRTYLGVGVLKRRDGREDFRETHQHVRTRDDPDADIGGQGLVIGGGASGWLVVVAGRLLEQEVLENTGVHHGDTGDKETGEDALDGREVDLVAAQGGVDELVHDGDEDQDGDGVQVPEAES